MRSSKNIESSLSRRVETIEDAVCPHCGKKIDVEVLVNLYDLKNSKKK